MHWPKDKNNQMFFCFATNKFSPYNHVQLPQQHPLPYYPGPRPSWMEEEGRSLLDPPSTMAGSRFWFTNSCTDSPSTGTFAAGRNGDFYPGFSTTKMGQNSPPPKKKNTRKGDTDLGGFRFSSIFIIWKTSGCLFQQTFFGIWKGNCYPFSRVSLKHLAEVKFSGTMGSTCRHNGLHKSA